MNYAGAPPRVRTPRAILSVTAELSLWLHSVRSLSPNYGAGGSISLAESLNLFGLLNVFFVLFRKQDVCQRNESVLVKKAAISRIRTAAEVDFTHALGC